jgi:uncharacterized protein
VNTRAHLFANELAIVGGPATPFASTHWLRAARISLFILVALAALVTGGGHGRAAETIPPAPTKYFNDFAGVVRPETAAELNAELAQFERDTSNQILVVIYPRMTSDSSVEDYTVRVAQSWRVGQKARDNGAVLFLFQESRDVRIVTGYGLEGALPDALAKRIIEDEMIPRFRAGDFDAGLSEGVRAMMAATRGEYRGSGRTAADGANDSPSRSTLIFLIIVALIMLSGLRNASRRQTVYTRRGPRTVWMDPGAFGRRGGGGWSGGGGGSFSGGGGRFGGGGAGGRW